MLQLSPERFRAERLQVGPLAELDFDLGNRKSSLSVEALKAGSASVTILIHLKLAIDESTGISVDFAADFAVTDTELLESFEVTDEVLLNTFIQVNAPAIAYPFLRAYVSTVSVNSGYSQVLLPPVNFQAIFNRRKKESDVSPLIPVR